MQSQNRIFEDLSRIATGAAGTLAGMGREFEQMVRERVKEFIGGLDLVTREEFEAVKESAAKARAEVEALRLRLDALAPGNTTMPAGAGGETPLPPSEAQPPV
jgi:BMFP domain-containing protein YqiC